MYISSVNQQNTRSCNSVNFKQLSQPYRRAMLLITDGVGISKDAKTNPILSAKIPFIQSLVKNINGKTLVTPVKAAETAVGLSKGEEGNSEAGHVSIGCGRKVKQTMIQIDEAIENGQFWENEAFLDAIKHANKYNTTLHIMGAVSNSHTHSKHEHIKALIEMARSHGVDNVAVHAFINGDGPSASDGLKFIKDIDEYLEQHDYPPIATVIGRNIAMNKSGDKEDIERAYFALTTGGSADRVDNIEEGLNNSFDKGYSGVNVPPIVRTNSKRIKDNDSVIYVNYRSDRARGLTKQLATDMSSYEDRPKNLHFVCMSEYNSDFNLPVAFGKDVSDDSIVEVLSNLGANQVAIADKEKSSHVTFFLRGCSKKQFPGVEEKILPPCKDVDKIDASIDKEVDIIVSELEDPSRDFIAANIKTGDFLGHKGDFELGIKAAENIDRGLERIVNSAIENEVPVVIVSDHGNLEDCTTSKHTKSEVPCFVVLPNHETAIANKSITIRKDAENALRDIAPTILDIMGLEKPELMTGQSLILDING